MNYGLVSVNNALQTLKRGVEFFRALLDVKLEIKFGVAWQAQLLSREIVRPWMFMQIFFL